MKRNFATRKQKDNTQSRFSSLNLSVIKYTLVGFVAIFLGLGWIKLHNPNTLPITNVKVQGNYAHIGQEKLLKTIQPYTNTGFFAINIESLTQHLLNMPWIQKVEISRTWPNRLNIQIQERKVIARWNNKSLLTSTGVLFSPPKSTFPKNIPQIHGPKGYTQQNLAVYRKMSQLLAPFGLHIAKLDLSSRLAWRLTLRNGMILRLGNHNVLIRLHRFKYFFLTNMCIINLHLDVCNGECVWIM